MNNDNHCILCGEIVPEGRNICPICMDKYLEIIDINEKHQQIIKHEKRCKEIYKTIVLGIMIPAIITLFAFVCIISAADMPRTMTPDTAHEPMAAITEPEPEKTEAEAEPQMYRITAYCGCAICCGADADGITASGTTATAGQTIAVDPNVIPLGSTVVIGEYEYIAEDVGDAIKGNEIDVYFDTHEDALRHGIQYMDVIIIGGNIK